MGMQYGSVKKTRPRVKGAEIKDDFSLVYDRYFTFIYKFIYYKTFHRELTEDLAGQAFLKGYEKYHTFDPDKGGVLAWLCRIASNVVADHFRKRTKTVSIHDVWDLAGSDNVELDLENREKARAVREMIAGLSATQRDILIWRIWQDLPFRTIARLVNKSEAGCKMLFSRTLLKLKGSLKAAAFLAVLGAPALFG
jgi:RNA polymerase sigma-70 factor (ECF subfamily)